MPPNKRIKLVLEGLPEDDGHVRADVFVREITAFTSAIKKSEHALGDRRGRPSFYLRVVALRYESPATIEYEAVPIDRDDDVCEEVLDRFAALYEQVQSGDVSSLGADSDLLYAFRELASPVGEQLNAVRIQRNGQVISIAHATAPRVDTILSEEEAQQSFVKGHLEYINLHSGINMFRIYPAHGPTRISCRFPERLRKDAINAVGALVVVRGNVKTKSVDYYPYEIDVMSIEIMPPDGDLPTLRSLRGSAPRLTGVMSTSEYIGSIRGA